MVMEFAQNLSYEFFEEYAVAGTFIIERLPSSHQ